MKKADIEVDKAVLKKTTRCHCDFSCLSGDDTCMCEVSEQTGLTSIKVMPNPDRSCAYLLRFNKSHYCVCPTRRELYKQHKI